MPFPEEPTDPEIQPPQPDAPYADALGFSSAAEAEIPAEAKNTMQEIFQKEVASIDKPEEIKKKMLDGKIATYFKEKTLLDQPFIKNGDETVGKLLENAKATIKEVKNGLGPAPIKTANGWLHLCHGVRNTAAGLRYVLYLMMADLKQPQVVTHRPAGYFLAPEGDERVGEPVRGGDLDAAGPGRRGSPAAARRPRSNRGVHRPAPGTGFRCQRPGDGDPAHQPRLSPPDLRLG